MAPPKRAPRSMMLLGGVLLLCGLTRIQLESFDYTLAGGASQPWGVFAAESWLAVALAGAASAAVALLVRNQLNRITVVGLAAAVGGIVLARFAHFTGIVIGFTAGMMVATFWARSAGIAVLALGYGTFTGALALATDRDLSDGPSFGACVLVALSAVVAASALFSVRVRRWPVIDVLHRRGRVMRAVCLAAVLVGFWLSLSVDTHRRLHRLDPNAQARLLPLGVRWLWPGPLGVWSLAPQPGAENLTDLRAHLELQRLWLDGARFNDDDLANLQGLSWLVYLRVADTRVSDQGFVHLRGLTRLQWLDLSGTQVRGDGLKYLSGMAWLNRIVLDRTGISDDALRHLQRLKRLSWVSLCGTSVTGPGVRSLQNMPALSFLRLDGCRIDDDAMQALAAITTLTNLGLSRNPITDKGLAHLQGLTRLTDLFLQETAVTDAGLETLASLRTLRFVDLRQTAVTVAGVERLRQALPFARNIEWDRGLAAGPPASAGQPGP